MPIRVWIGRVVRKNRRGIPGALLLSTIALWTPGPHHSFSVATPSVTRPASTANVLCPGSSRQMGRYPNRCGRSMEYGWTCHGEDNGYLPDRKSTRLNSSHVKISYAVFCLKKKKNKTKR